MIFIGDLSEKCYYRLHGRFVAYLSLLSRFEYNVCPKVNLTLHPTKPGARIQQISCSVLIPFIGNNLLLCTGWSQSHAILSAVFLGLTHSCSINCFDVFLNFVDYWVGLLLEYCFLYEGVSPGFQVSIA
uniref:Uncharacterized protein n=1 Tax=Cacopsylla melanoneura TaxID=428564 RepID=A0A8D8X7I3_9HEMI